VNVRAVPPPEISRLSLSEDDSGHGEIRMVKEFVSYSFLLDEDYDYEADDPSRAL
jgi:hypothetical protein